MFAIILLENGAKAKLSIKDASYNHISSLEEVVKLNEERLFKILETNTDFSRISVGIKQLETDPRDKVFNSISLGDVVHGQVVKILPVGALIKLENGLTALAVTRENSDRANVATHHIYKINSEVTGYISHIDAENRKLNIITKVKAE